MDYSTLSLVELKQHAKVRRIKQYYIMKRNQLIELLNMTELPASYRIEKMTIHELRAEARARGVRGFWNLSRGQLVELLFPPNQNHQNQGDTQEHDTPEKHTCQNVGIQNIQDAQNNRAKDGTADVGALNMLHNVGNEHIH